MKDNKELMRLLTPDAPAVRAALQHEAATQPATGWDALLDPLARILRPDLRGALAEPGSAGPLIVYPGLGRDSLAMRPLLRLARRLGYDTRDWGHGINLGPTGRVDDFIDTLSSEVERAAREAGRPVTLLGWSLGGVYAREIARSVPDAVRHVVAFGSAGPRGDAFGIRWLLRWAARTRREDVRALLERLRRPLLAPMTCLVALADGSITCLPALTT